MIKIILLSLLFQANSFAAKTPAEIEWEKENTALVSPRKLANNDKISTLTYKKDHIYTYTGIYNQYSFIRFSSDEKIIGGAYINNPGTWSITVTGKGQNSLFIYPIAKAKSTTNMTIITSKRTYYFILEAKNTKELSDPDLVFETRFIYPETDTSDFTIIETAGKTDNIDFSEPGKYNFNYTYSGSNKIAPLRIFDDGDFTYFEFAAKNTELPAIFYVDSDGYEGLINYRVEGNYVIVERVNAIFTLRHGANTVCVFNETLKAKAQSK